MIYVLQVYWIAVITVIVWLSIDWARNKSQKSAIVESYGYPHNATIVLTLILMAAMCWPFLLAAEIFWGRRDRTN